jgi:hypothetical protein
MHLQELRRDIAVIVARNMTSASRLFVVAKHGSITP